MRDTCPPAGARSAPKASVPATDRSTDGCRDLAFPARNRSPWVLVLSDRPQRAGCPAQPAQGTEATGEPALAPLYQTGSAQTHPGLVYSQRRDELRKRSHPPAASVAPVGEQTG